MSAPRFKLYYWPLPFRGCFVSYPFAYHGVPLEEASDERVVQAMRTDAPSHQKVPFMGPPVLEDRERGMVLSQVPAILLYLAEVLPFQRRNPVDTAVAMKVVMDCNDLLMEICRYNGTLMWQKQDWLEFRSNRLPLWMQVFEESLRRGDIGREDIGIADISVYALFGNMMRCLPALGPDLLMNAPGIHSLCEAIGRRPSLAAYVARQERRYGDLYCGGQIETSIRAMIAAQDGA